MLMTKSIASVIGALTIFIALFGTVLYVALWFLDYIIWGLLIAALVYGFTSHKRSTAE